MFTNNQIHRWGFTFPLPPNKRKDVSLCLEIPENFSRGMLWNTVFQPLSFSKEENVLYFPIRNTVLYISFIKNLFFAAWDSSSCVTVREGCSEQLLL